MFWDNIRGPKRESGLELVTVAEPCSRKVDTTRVLTFFIGVLRQYE